MPTSSWAETALSSWYSSPGELDQSGSETLRFVELLAEREVLPHEAAEEILEGKNQDPAWFGTLAFLLGFLEREDIDSVLRRQRGTGLRFGEQARHMGLLDEGQSAQIETLQVKHRVLFTEVAWALERLTPEEIASYLAELLT